MLRKSAIRMVGKSVFKSNIFDREKRLTLQASNKSEKTEPKYSLHRSQNEESHFNGASSERRFLCKLDLKYAYFSMAFGRNSQKYLRLPWRGNLYEFLCLCIGLGPALRIFTKLMKILIELVRHLNVQLII